MNSRHETSTNNSSCVLCGTEFIHHTPNHTKIYCSESCRQKAYYERRRRAKDGHIKFVIARRNKFLSKQKMKEVSHK